MKCHTAQEELLIWLNFCVFKFFRKAISTILFLILKKKPFQTEKTSPKPTLPLTRGWHSHLGVCFSFRKADLRGEMVTLRKLVETSGGRGQRSNCLAHSSVTLLELCGCSCPRDTLMITGLDYWTKFSSWEARVFSSSLGHCEKQYQNINIGRV